MVFVHTRNGTIRTANVLKELAMKENQLDAFQPDESPKFTLAKKSISRLKNKQVAELFPLGFACHHAGMLRADRTIIENYFGDGLIKVLVCTSTLAWGVNLPAHAVIIRVKVLFIFCNIRIQTSTNRKKFYVLMKLNF